MSADNLKAGRTLALALMFLGYFFNFVDRMAMSVTIPYIGQEFHLSKTGMGMVLSAFFAGYTVMQIPGGILVDKFGPRRVMTIAFTLWSLFTGLTGAAIGFGTLVVTRALFGVGEAPFPAATMKYIALRYEPSKRATATAVLLSSNSLGLAAAPLLVVTMMELWGWRGVYYSLALPGLVVALLVAKFVADEPPGAKAKNPIAASPGERAAEEADVSFWEVLRAPAVFKSTLLFFLANIASWGFRSWLPAYLVSARHMDMRAMGVTASLPFFAGIGGYLIAGPISDGLFKDDRRIPVILFQLSTALFLYLTCTAQSMGLLVIFQTATGFFLSAMQGATWALPVSIVAKKMTGRGVGIFNTGGQLAGMLSPTIIGYLVDLQNGRFEVAFIFMICSLLAAASIGLTLKVRTGETA